jgi:hypothetical protein
MKGRPTQVSEEDDFHIRRIAGNIMNKVRFQVLAATSINIYGCLLGCCAV